MTIDWNLARMEVPGRSIALWDPDFKIRASRQIGGAALVGELIATAAGLERQRITIGAPSGTPSPLDAAYCHSFSSCRPFPHGREKGRLVWRIEQFWGLDRRAVPVKPANQRADRRRANILVLDDANQGFRDHFTRDRWPEWVPSPADEASIVLKWARPDLRPEALLGNGLWDHLYQHYANSLIVVFTANDLRLMGMQISRELSWEKTAQDVAREVTTHPSLSRCSTVVISFYTAGAVVCSQGNTTWTTSLYYDPRGIEGEWFQAYEGHMAGYTQCFVAGLVYGLLQDGNSGGLCPGVMSGIAASRFLHEEGFGPVDNQSSEPPALHIRSAEIGEKIRQIYQRAKVSSDGSGFSVVRVPNEGYWTIMNYDDDLHVADEIIQRGPSRALAKFPTCQFADILTVDREESESLRSIGALMKEYWHAGTQRRPLSIVVFGAPGSGKSTGVTAVAKAVGLGPRIERREFNLSQFRGPNDLLGALHQVRDDALSGLVPLAFWDEFDTKLDDQELGWLRYFLAPMQDGKFQEGQVTHSIGKAIFVFAGGTKYSLDAFKNSFEDLGESEAERRRKDAKVPDFLSRVKGYVNIPNLDHSSIREARVTIRRAIMLRSMLQRAAPNLFRRVAGEEDVVDVDEGVRHAFLSIPCYKYGARSMESIVHMSLLTDKRVFERSSLPSELQLNLHVDAQCFLKLVREKA